MKPAALVATATGRPCRGAGSCLLALGASVVLSACSTLSTYLPAWLTTPPSFSLPWFGHANKLGPLPAFNAKVAPRLRWQVAIGSSANGSFAPAVRGDAAYVASEDGTIVSVDPANGAERWRVSAGKHLSAGVGANATLVVVGTDKGDVLALDATGKPLWQAKVSSEVSGPPKATDDAIVVWSLDGKIFGLSPKDGSRQWVFQRTTPPLTVRHFAGGIVIRGALFTGTAGGKLLAIDVPTGTLVWEGNVTTPKGATELERLADITSLPVMDERQVCAAAFQGRVACFDPQRGTLTWSRDFGSLGGLALDNRYLYLTDDKGAIEALDKDTGASIWKQAKLSDRAPSGPVVVGDYLGVVDGAGYLHLLDRNDGNLVGRLATDGKPASAQPVATGNLVVWQSVGGKLIGASTQ
jgi:outer membrane protein assembly factor BamB